MVGLLLLQIPAIKDRALWGYIQADAYLRGVIHPAGQIPTPLQTAVTENTSLPTASLSPHRAHDLGSGFRRLC